jgi:hypothetical protein
LSPKHIWYICFCVELLTRLIGGPQRAAADSAAEQLLGGDGDGGGIGIYTLSALTRRKPIEAAVEEAGDGEHVPVPATADVHENPLDTHDTHKPRHALKRVLTGG